MLNKSELSCITENEMSLIILYMTSRSSNFTIVQNYIIQGVFATVLSAAMLLKYGLGEVEAAERIECSSRDTEQGISNC
ncbi:unnamed protein product [Trifolium pratense]|uniref:Uncharacterized protein n=1 Tax=Trifolium pratense TaxID=57577 RepID=A0ACB0KW71_TRIPR|nr:unnamed protein product [Trifolium pratense]